MKSNASVVWKGSLKDGAGAITTESGVLKDTPYSFKTRFDGQPGTNPEELIAAAHASCFTMALSGQLAIEHLTAERINTTATVTLEKSADGFTITAVHLNVTAKLPNADKEAFIKAAENAKKGCPVSKLLNAKITMEANIEG